MRSRLVFVKIFLEVEYGAAVATRMNCIEMSVPTSNVGKDSFAISAIDIVGWRVLVLSSCLVALEYLVTVLAFEGVPCSVVLPKVMLIREVPFAEITVAAVIGIFMILAVFFPVKSSRTVVTLPTVLRFSVLLECLPTYKPFLTRVAEGCHGGYRYPHGIVG